MLLSPEAHFMLLADANSGTGFLQALLIFGVAGFLYAWAALVFSWLIRPSKRSADKSSAYECGEVAVGPGWIQFDLRFYVVALVFLVFDVELALFYPWAVVYGGGGLAGTAAAEYQSQLHQVRWAALWDMLFFFGVIVVGFAYLWRFGYLNWVRAIGGQRRTSADPASQSRAA